MKIPELLPDWASEKSSKLGNDILIAKHRLSDTGVFSDESLINMIDQHPMEDFGISSMGSDPNTPSDWQDGERGDLTGEELFQAVQKGRIWLNLRRVVDNHSVVADVVNQLYDELERKCSGLKTFNRSANLLISSPSAIVYYHMDCPFNMLWHISGRKRVWVYPIEEKYLPTQTREDVLFGASTEEIRYLPEFDDAAFVRDLEPDELVTWPLHSPHRVVNTSDVNVSLSTEHYTKQVLRVNNVYLANRYFRNWSHAFAQSNSPDGLSGFIKENAIRLVRRIPGLAPQSPKNYIYPKTFVVDLEAPNCVRPINHEASAHTEELEPVAV